ncbi:MAG: ACT domain-containing protein [Treponema sp.]|jgi:3-deoxy-7-phosphoheptulonate synthase|nr:ACT domain-containing protein [Treponema sp.]
MPSNAGRIAFCGEQGAFAQIALFRAFGEDAANLPVSTFAAVFDAVREGSAAFGVIPVENSLAGSIHENYDLFLKYPDIVIAGEIKIRIVHNLIVHPDASWDTIKIVRSHPQALAQCKVFLDQHPGWRLETWNNTAAAVVSIVSDMGGISDIGGENDPLAIAAIASGTAAKLNGLKILKAGIETNPANYTRFVIISCGEGEKISRPFCLGGDPNNKASVVFAIKDEPGSLYSCLKILAESNINLLKIESRPIHGQPWHYMFYLDLTIPADQDNFEAAVAALKKKAEDFYFLGSYRAAL